MILESHPEIEAVDLDARHHQVHLAIVRQAEQLPPVPFARDLEMGEIDGVVDMPHRVGVTEPDRDIDPQAKLRRGS